MTAFIGAGYASTTASINKAVTVSCDKGHKCDESCSKDCKKAHKKCEKGKKCCAAKAGGTASASCTKSAGAKKSCCLKAQDTKSGSANTAVKATCGAKKAEAEPAVK